MNRELQELKLPTGARGRALQHARRAVAADQPVNDREVVDEAFASYQPEPRRADAAHATPAAAGEAQAMVQQISQQLQQIDKQRRELARLLEMLDEDATNHCEATTQV